MDKPKYIIVAGINGAGKSTLYTLQPGLFAGTTRINADEILKSNQGDWHNASDNFKAMREAVKLLHLALDQHQSIHVETTLSGSGKAQLKLIDKAHRQGFEVILLYVALKSPQMAIARVNERVAKGGHGVPSALIQKRYKQSAKNLPNIAQMCDQVVVYDNSDVFKNVYIRKNNQIIKNDLALVPWINLASSPKERENPKMQ